MFVHPKRKCYFAGGGAFFDFGKIELFVFCLSFFFPAISQSLLEIFDLEKFHFLAQCFCETKFISIFFIFLSFSDFISNQFHDFGIMIFSKSYQNMSKYGCMTKKFPGEERKFSKFSEAEKRTSPWSS